MQCPKSLYSRLHLERRSRNKYFLITYCMREYFVLCCLGLYHDCSDFETAKTRARFRIIKKSEWMYFTCVPCSAIPAVRCFDPLNNYRIPSRSDVPAPGIGAALRPRIPVAVPRVGILNAPVSSTPKCVRRRALFAASSQKGSAAFPSGLK